MTAIRKKRFLLLAFLLIAGVASVSSWNALRPAVSKASSTAPAVQSPLHVAYAASGSPESGSAATTSEKSAADKLIEAAFTDFNTWADGFDSQNASESDVKRGVELARTREMVLKQLIKDKPEDALKRA